MRAKYDGGVGIKKDVPLLNGSFCMQMRSYGSTVMHVKINVQCSFELYLFLK